MTDRCRCVDIHGKLIPLHIVGPDNITLCIHHLFQLTKAVPCHEMLVYNGCIDNNMVPCTYADDELGFTPQLNVLSNSYYVPKKKIKNQNCSVVYKLWGILNLLVNDISENVLRVFKYDSSILESFRIYLRGIFCGSHLLLKGISDGKLTRTRRCQNEY